MRVGITTTVPVEVLLAGGHAAVDINNAFINSTDPVHYISNAHAYGFPRSLCAWIKGQHSVITSGGFDAIVAVATGDCSNVNAMIELLTDGGIKVFKFVYPTDNDAENSYGDIAEQIKRLADFSQVSVQETAEQFTRLRPVREKLRRLDELTVGGYVSGAENHTWLVSSSDFNSDLQKYETELDRFVAEAEKRVPFIPEVRLGYIGVPPIITDLYHHIRKCRADILFNEVQRQFSIPYRCTDIYRAYLNYTYPYTISGRIKDIQSQAASRKLHGLIHYVQSFCHRQIYDILLKKYLPIPVLTIEGDAPGILDERSKIRIESFIEMLAGRNKVD